MLPLGRQDYSAVRYLVRHCVNGRPYNIQHTLLSFPIIYCICLFPSDFYAFSHTPHTHSYNSPLKVTSYPAPLLPSVVSMVTIISTFPGKNEMLRDLQAHLPEPFKRFITVDKIIEYCNRGGRAGSEYALPAPLSPLL